MIITKKELDAIGEIFNIGMGSSATALSVILDKPVKISVPNIQIIHPADLDITYLEPAFGISVDYTEGLTGTNSLLLKREDVLKLASAMAWVELTEIDELSSSAICELMNQMMGSASTGIAEFLGITVDISTPKIGEIADTTSYKNFMYGQFESVMTITFELEVEGFLKTNFVTVMSSDICKTLLAHLRKLKENAMMSE